MQEHTTITYKCKEQSEIVLHNVQLTQIGQSTVSRCPLIHL